MAYLSMKGKSICEMCEDWEGLGQYDDCDGDCSKKVFGGRFVLIDVHEFVDLLKARSKVEIDALREKLAVTERALKARLQDVRNLEKRYDEIVKERDGLEEQAKHLLRQVEDPGGPLQELRCPHCGMFSFAEREAVAGARRLPNYCCWCSRCVDEKLETELST